MSFSSAMTSDAGSTEKALEKDGRVAQDTLPSLRQLQALLTRALLCFLLFPPPLSSLSRPVFRAVL